MGKLFYIADTHFGHGNILRFDGRPFSSVAQMEDVIVQNWNRTVTDKDDVYILGDFCWGKADDWLRLLKLLRGRKTLITGNHDLKRFPAEVRNRLCDVKDYKEIIDDGRKIILCHYPILFYRLSYVENVWHFHGHTHAVTQEEADRLRFVRALVSEHQEAHTLNRGQIVNVGCMMPYMDYTPRTADELIAWWKGEYGA